MERLLFPKFFGSRCDKLRASGDGGAYPAFVRHIAFDHHAEVDLRCEGRVFSVAPVAKTVEWSFSGANGHADLVDRPHVGVLVTSQFLQLPGTRDFYCAVARGACSRCPRVKQLDAELRAAFAIKEVLIGHSMRHPESPGFV